VKELLNRSIFVLKITRARFMFHGVYIPCTYKDVRDYGLCGFWIVDVRQQDAGDKERGKNCSNVSSSGEELI